MSPRRPSRPKPVDEPKPAPAALAAPAAKPVPAAAQAPRRPRQALVRRRPVVWRHRGPAPAAKPEPCWNPFAPADLPK